VNFFDGQFDPNLITAQVDVSVDNRSATLFRGVLGMVSADVAIIPLKDGFLDITVLDGLHQIPIEDILDNLTLLEDWQTYNNEEFGFEFQYPSEWRFSYPGPPFRLSLSYKSEERYCEPWHTVYVPSQNVSCFPPGEIDLTLPNPAINKEPNQVLIEHVDDIIGSWKDWVEDVSISSTELLDRNAVSVVVDERENRNQFGDILYYVEISPEDVLSFSTGYQPKYKDYVLGTFDQILSTFRFIEPVDTPDWQIYRNEEFGFEFQYPLSWRDTTFDYGDDSTEFHVEREDEMVTFYVEVEDDIELFNLLRAAQPGEIVENNNLRFRKVTDGEVDNYPAVRFVDEDPRNIPRFIGSLGEEVLVSREGQAFHIVLWTWTDELVQEYVSTFEQILSTFRFVE